MPRPYWEAKNPYCRRSKLTRAQFERIAYFYFLEIASGWSRHACAGMILAGEEGARLSRQSISLYFDAIGDFLWEHIVVAADPRYADKERLDDFLSFLYGKSDEPGESYDLVGAFLRTVPLERAAKPSEPLVRTLMFDILRRRSKAVRGFAPDQFHREVARAVFVCAVLEARGARLRSNEDFFSYKNAKNSARLAWTVLLDILERHPLDRVE